jgi:hypothetical protein
VCIASDERFAHVDAVKLTIALAKRDRPLVSAAGDRVAAVPLVRSEQGQQLLRCCFAIRRIVSGPMTGLPQYVGIVLDRDRP